MSNVLVATAYTQFVDARDAARIVSEANARELTPDLSHDVALVTLEAGDVVDTATMSDIDREALIESGAIVARPAKGAKKPPARKAAKK